MLDTVSIKFLHLMDINDSLNRAKTLVPIALGKYLFSFRTQKSSLVAAIILLCGKLARCRIIQTSHPNGWLFVVYDKKKQGTCFLFV